MDTGTVLAVALTVLIAVLVRGAMTLADISSALERIASRGGEARMPAALAAAAAAPAAAAPAPGAAAGAPGGEPTEAEIVAVIAVAREALAGALPASR